MKDLFGGRLERMILFGSRACGDSQADSDYVVAVFLRDMTDRAEEVEVETDILFDSGVVINALPFPAEAYRERTGFMSELRRDRLDL